MNSDNSEEIFPVVDAAGNVVGKATRGECHGGSMLLHPVVHLHECIKNCFSCLLLSSIHHLPPYKFEEMFNNGHFF